MSSIPRPLIFERSGLFFNTVTSFYVAYAGIRSIMHPRDPMGLRNKSFKAILTGKIYPKLLCDALDLHEKSISGNIDPKFLITSLHIALINTAYELAKKSYDKSQIFEFFRHIRNAASHNNQFKFWPDQPSREAEWRSLRIDHKKKGKANPLYGKKLFYDFMEPADPFLLLWDIEHHVIAEKKLKG